MYICTLPPELWELVCSFLPQKDVCRLRSLNHFFLSAALRIHYGTFVVEFNDPKVRSSFKHQYAMDYVHTLHLKNCIEVPPFQSYKFPWWGDNFLSFRASLASKFSRYPVLLKDLKRLRNVQNLHLEFGPLQSTSFNTIVFYSLRERLVHLDLRFTNYQHFGIFWLGNSVIFPNVRSLGITFDEIKQERSINPPFVERTILGIRSLVDPSNIESLHLGRLCWSSYKPCSLSLDFFDKLKKLVCVALTDFTYFPYDMVQLVNINIQTLVDLRIHERIVIDYTQLDWSEEVHSLSFGAIDFFWNRHILLPRLTKCQLRTLELAGILSGFVDLHTVSLNAEEYEDFHKTLLLALSGSTSSLIHLEIPYLTLSFQRIWNIVSTFPNLDTLIFFGTPNQKDPETRRVLLQSQFFAGRIPLPAGVAFHNLKTSSTRLCEIRKCVEVEGSSALDIWQEHSKAIEDAFANCSSTSTVRCHWSS